MLFLVVSGLFFKGKLTIMGALRRIHEIEVAIPPE